MTLFCVKCDGAILNVKVLSNLANVSKRNVKHILNLLCIVQNCVCANDTAISNTFKFTKT